MSDPVTNLEIEDVLSSIRRLVAEGDKLRSGTAPADPMPETAVESQQSEPSEAQGPGESAEEQDAAPQSPADKFVLTSALRVDRAAPSPTVVLWDEEDEASTSEPQADAAEVQNLLADSDQSVGEHSHADDASDAAWDDGAHEDRPASEADEDAGQVDRTIDEPTPESDGRSRLEATIAELEAAITGKADEWEPDGSEATPIMDWSAEVAEPKFLSSRNANRSAPIEDAEEVSEGEAAPEGVTEPLILEQAARPEERPADNPDHAGPEPLEGELEDTLTAYLEEDEVLDEETLRNLVVEIVRQELQGALGERITRNVRKLVRREIHRVLSSQDFD